MKFTHALLLACSLAFFACGDDDDDSSTGPSTPKYDCSVKGGVKVVYPAGGESFKIGEEITVVYGTDVDGSGYRFVFKVDEEDMGMDFFEESMTWKARAMARLATSRRLSLIEGCC